MSPRDKDIGRVLRGAPVLVTATVALMEELARVLFAEIEIVSKRKIKEHPELLKYKQKLAVDYRANMKAIAAQPDVVRKLSEEAKQIVREMARLLAEAVEANARALRAAINATRHLIQSVMAMVRSETMPRQTYKNHAKAHMQLGNYSPTCPPVAVSRTV